MAHYLLTLEETFGDDTIGTHHLIEAEDPQMVKYHFHRTLKDWGFTDSAFGKHCLKRGIGEKLIEIESIKPLKPKEYHIMNKYLGQWAKL